MNKVILKRIIFTILIIVNCLVIFKFSSQDADTSSQTSGVVVNKIVEKPPGEKRKGSHNKWKYMN